MRHAVRTVLLLIAAGIILIAGMFLGLEIAKGRMGHGTPSVWLCILYAILVLAGVGLVWKSNAIAAHLTDDFDE